MFLFYEILRVLGHRELLEKIRDFANKQADLSKCSSYRLTFSRCWVEILITVSTVALLVFMHVPKQVKPLKS